MLFKKGVLKNLASFTGKHLCWSLILLKLRTPPVAASDCIVFFSNYSVFLIEYQITCCYRKIALLLKQDDNANINKATFH